ncbi:MAG: (2Fe-2S)-binding protein [Gammaproteobacteria bacterium]|uniref:(2Fe-2S)-binding protein n=1 Tax=Candidatus Thiopontia autotrophica TaxID=2841688 RepID=A0A8J6TS61_9GAMM|nr:(2Fe-2S)-binding protein [Candidatus Thiopontia autotrophica]MBL6968670.1 (2Fe-2S)-binding protein [Gammaproteobacteria bacterium]
MSDTQTKVHVTINGKQIHVSSTLSVIQALWKAGYPRVQGVGCLEGVCGSCRVLVRRAETDEISMEMGCQTLVEDGMEVMFLVFPSPSQHSYSLEQIQNSWEVQTEFHKIFPEAQQCRNCHGCTTSCPKDIDVEKGVELAVKGRFKEAGDLFIECVMCDLCMTGCPEQIAPNHVGLFARRVTAYFHSRPSNLINRLEKIRTGALQVIKE